jgi:uncharacterized tellurite resistance protein B-like protein
MVQELLLPLGNGQRRRNGRRLWDRRRDEGEPIMMESIKKFFMSNMAEAATAEEDAHPGDLRLAACALLLELAYADDDFTDTERSHLEFAVRRQFGLDQDQAAELVQLAEDQRAEAVDLWSFTNLIADNYSLGQKMVLAEAMWGLVFSDGNLASREDYLMRKISGLLRLEAGYLAEARKRVEEHQPPED